MSKVESGKIRFLCDHEVPDDSGDSYSKDEVCEMNIHSCNHFVKRGLAEFVDNKTAVEKPSPDDDPATVEEIIEAIELLDDDNDENWIADGRADVKALEGLLGKKVTAAQRDEAWAAFNESDD
jgi:hypothetical protein